MCLKEEGGEGRCFSVFCLSIWGDFVSALGARAFPETGRGEAVPKYRKMQFKEENFPIANLI